MRARGRQRHIKRLCEAFCIAHKTNISDVFDSRFTTDFEHATGSWSNSTIYTPPIKTHKDYAVALHEIGHLVCKVMDLNYHLTRQVTQKTLEVEMVAWEYAFKQAMEPIDRSVPALCLKTYISCMPKPPAQNHRVWEWINENG